MRFCSFGSAFKLTVVNFDLSINTLTLQEKETTLNSKVIRFILFDFICILETKTQELAKLMTIFVTNEVKYLKHSVSFFFSLTVISCGASISLMVLLLMARKKREYILQI